jgi:CRP/FNR family cyclic AMP-dependent transcriptional regulator
MNKTESRVAPPDILHRLEQHPFLDGMERHHLELLAESAMPVQFEKGQLIFKAGEPANGFYLIESGSVALQGSVSEHGPITADIVRAGEPLGWSWLFPPYLWHFDARALEPIRSICFSGIALRQHRDEDLALSHELFRRMSEVMVRRLQHARAELVKSGKANTK